MNRTIKFRGKRPDNKGWAYGDFIHGVGMHYGDSYILPNQQWLPTDCDPLDGYRVDPDSVEQYTGLKDRRGKEVYEGDVVFWIAKDMRGRGRGEQGAIFWDKDTMSWAILRDKPTSDGRPCIISRPFDRKHLEVVGNIHDNPDLMKGSAE